MSRSAGCMSALAILLAGVAATGGCAWWQDAHDLPAPRCDTTAVLTYYALARHSGGEPASPEIAAPGCPELYAELLTQVRALPVHDLPPQSGATREALRVLVSDLAALNEAAEEEQRRREALAQENAGLRRQLSDLQKQIDALKRIDGHLEERVRATP